MRLRPTTAFAVVSLLWGTPYLLVKVALADGVPAMFVAWSRIAFAAALLVVLAWWSGQLHSLRGRWSWVALYAGVEIVMPFACIALGEQYISSSLTAEIIAAVPLFIALLALRYDVGDTLTPKRVVGLLVGFAGVVVLLGVDVSGTGEELLGAGLILAAGIGFSIGPLVFKRHLADLEPNATVGVGLVLATVALAPFAVLDPPTEMPATTTLVALAALGLFCTAVALVLFAQLIARVGPGRAVLTTYVAPVIAVALGMVVLGERPGPGALAGLVLVLVGAWLANQTRRGSSPDASVSDAPAPGYVERSSGFRTGR